MKHFRNKVRGEEMQHTEKKRGRFLAIWLILMPVVNSVTLYFALALFHLLGGDWIPGTTEAQILTIVIIITLNISPSVAVWKWKRWGVYGLAVMTVAVFITSILALSETIAPGRLVQTNTLAVLASVGLVEIIVLAILVRPIWKHLE